VQHHRIETYRRLTQQNRCYAMIHYTAKNAEPAAQQDWTMFCRPHCSHLSIILNNIVEPQSGVTILFNIVDNCEQCGQQSIVQSCFHQYCNNLIVFCRVWFVIKMLSAVMRGIYCPERSPFWIFSRDWMPAISALDIRRYAKTIDKTKKSTFCKIPP
jgi:hypothetical protein